MKKKYAIIDSKGKIIEKFKTKGTATAWLSEVKKRVYDNKCEIVELKSSESKNKTFINPL